MWWNPPLVVIRLKISQKIFFSGTTVKLLLLYQPNVVSLNILCSWVKARHIRVLFNRLKQYIHKKVWSFMFAIRRMFFWKRVIYNCPLYCLDKSKSCWDKSTTIGLQVILLLQFSVFYISFLRIFEEFCLFLNNSKVCLGRTVFMP